MDAFIILFLVFGLASWSLSMNLTSGSIWLAAKLNAHATPNHRTSHEGAVPRLGGIGPVCAIILLFIVTWSAFPTLQRLIGISPVDVIPWQQGVLFLALGIGGFTLGLLDDLGRLPTLGKLLGQFVLACLPAGLGVVIHEVEWPYFGTVELPYFLGALLSGLWVVLIMNVYNFMDGINGLAGRALETFGYGLLLMTLNLSFRYQFSILACIMLGAALGFLRHNIAVPTRTFLGDCGSQGLGAMMAAAALMVHNNDNGLGFHDPFLPFVILLFPLIFDVCLTLIRRSLKGKNLLQPHREHLYQRYLVCIGEKHDRCLSFVSNFLYTSAILAPIYFRFYPGNGPLRLILIGIAVGMMIFQWHRVLRLEEQRPSALVK